MSAPLELTVRCVGQPAPQGSKTFKGTRNGHAIMVESSKAVRPWRRDVERAARGAITAWQNSESELNLQREFVDLCKQNGWDPKDVMKRQRAKQVA